MVVAKVLSIESAGETKKAVLILSDDMDVSEVIIKNVVRRIIEDKGDFDFKYFVDFVRSHDIGYVVDYDEIVISLEEEVS